MSYLNTLPKEPAPETLVRIEPSPEWDLLIVNGHPFIPVYCVNKDQCKERVTNAVAMGLTIKRVMGEMQAKLDRLNEYVMGKEK